MPDKPTLAELERRLEEAERELAAWQKSKYGAANAPIAAKLVEALRAQIAALRSSE